MGIPCGPSRIVRLRAGTAMVGGLGTSGCAGNAPTWLLTGSASDGSQPAADVAAQPGSRRARPWSFLCVYLTILFNPRSPFRGQRLGGRGASRVANPDAPKTCRYGSHDVHCSRYRPPPAASAASCAGHGGRHHRCPANRPGTGCGHCAACRWGERQGPERAPTRPVCDRGADHRQPLARPHRPGDVRRDLDPRAAAAAPWGLAGDRGGVFDRGGPRHAVGAPVGRVEPPDEAARGRARALHAARARTRMVVPTGPGQPRPGRRPPPPGHLPGDERALREPHEARRGRQFRHGRGQVRGGPAWPGDLRRGGLRPRLAVPSAPAHQPGRTCEAARRGHRPASVRTVEPRCRRQPRVGGAGTL